MEDIFLNENEIIEEAAKQLENGHTRENMIGVLKAVHVRMLQDGHFLVPTQPKFKASDFVDVNNAKVGEEITLDKPCAFELCKIQDAYRKKWMVAFTSQAEYEKGQQVPCVFSHFIGQMLTAVLESETVEGLVLNPWGDMALTLPKSAISVLLEAHKQTQHHNTNNNDK